MIYIKNYNLIKETYACIITNPNKLLSFRIKLLDTKKASRV